MSNAHHNLMAIGADYSLAETSKAFVYFAQIEADQANNEDTTVGIGFEHRFTM